MVGGWNGSPASELLHAVADRDLLYRQDADANGKGLYASHPKSQSQELSKQGKPSRRTKSRMNAVPFSFLMVMP
jgi:hypothetical protein